jgi:predicted  nucleic acid-binding Zn-ribbon protein
MANTDALLNELQTLNKRLDGLEHGQNTLAKGLQRLEGKMDETEKRLSEKIETVDQKVEAVHAYQQKAHAEIMDRLYESNEANGHEQPQIASILQLGSSTSLDFRHYLTNY